MNRRDDFKTVEEAMDFINKNPNFSGIVSLKVKINTKLPDFLIGKNEVLTNIMKSIDYLEISLEVKGSKILSSEIKQIHKKIQNKENIKD